jgi:lauroyl/myristoyl acyltransferase
VAELYGPELRSTRNELREGFFRLFQASLLTAAKRGQGLGAYRAMAKTVHRLCADAWLQATVLPGEARLVRRFLAETQLEVPNPGAVVHMNLMANSWRAIANRYLQGLERRDFMSLCSVVGADNLTAAQIGGRGVVVTHSHTTLAPLFWCWMQHAGIPSGVSIWQWAWKKVRSETEDPRIHTIQSARELHQAFRLLREGGLVHVVADGEWGSREIVLPFCNRKRAFRPAFAELAVSASAQVLAVNVHLGPDGQISIEIGAPFPQKLSDAHAERVRSLVLSYAEQLRSRWQAHPADLQWYIMHQHLSLPRL